MNMTHTTSRNKVNVFLPSEQVRTLLQKKGYGKIFNYADYEDFKKKTKSSFNQVTAITHLFIETYQDIQSDFNQYIF